MIRSRALGIIESQAWWLLLLVFVPGMVLHEPQHAKEIFQYAVLWPVLLYALLNPGVLVAMHRETGARLFTLFFLYSIGTLLWEYQKSNFEEAIYRSLGVYALLILVFVAITHRVEKLISVERLFLVASLGCLLMALFYAGRPRQWIDILPGYSLFNHHVFISWLAAVSALLLLARRSTLSVFQCALLCFFLYSIIFSRGRGGLMAFTAGYLLMLFLQDFPQREKRVTLCAVLAFGFAFFHNPVDLKTMVGKRYSSRPEIWQKGLEQSTEQTSRMVAGHGKDAQQTITLKNKARIPHRHSLYLSLLFQGGIIALSLYLAFLLWVLQRGLRHQRHNPWLYVVSGMSVALLVDGDGFFLDPSPLMICFILPLFLLLFSSPDKACPHETHTA